MEFKKPYLMKIIFRLYENGRNIRTLDFYDEEVSIWQNVIITLNDGDYVKMYNDYGEKMEYYIQHKTVDLEDEIIYYDLTV